MLTQASCGRGSSSPLTSKGGFFRSACFLLTGYRHMIRERALISHKHRDKQEADPNRRRPDTPSDKT